MIGKVLSDEWIEFLYGELREAPHNGIQHAGSGYQVGRVEVVTQLNSAHRPVSREQSAKQR